MTKFDLQLRDCLEGMSKLKTHSIDLVVTSPPYNLGIAVRKIFDRGKREDYLDWCLRWATELRRLLKPDGSFFLNLGASPSNPMLPHELVSETARPVLSAKYDSLDQGDLDRG